MGLMNAINTMINTAYSLLIDTVLYLTAMCVLMGAVSALLSEFGVIALLNKLLSPLMNPIYSLPGAASAGIVTTFLADNPAVLALAEDKRFRCFFKKYQFPALTNLATSFGMGMVVCTYMLSLSTVTGCSYLCATAVGFCGAVIGSVVSTRIMIRFTTKQFGKESLYDPSDAEGSDAACAAYKQKNNLGYRVLSSLLEGGKVGVKMGVDIIPGVLIICTFVLMLTKGPGEMGTYTGAAYEGIALLPQIAQYISPILVPLFGFSSPEAISVPITALGAAGASLSMTRQLLIDGKIGSGDIAVFTAMCMCWSGYLSTHISMMDSLKCRELTGKAIVSHTVGGLCAGIVAHWIFVLVSLI